MMVAAKPQAAKVNESEEEKKLLSGGTVKYIGLSHERVITTKDFRSIHSGSTGAQWDKSNRFTLPIEDFDDNALEYFNNEDPEFVVKEASKSE